MATRTWYTSSESYFAKLSTLGAVTIATTQSTAYRFESGTYSITFLGTGLGHTTNLVNGNFRFTTGIITTIEQRDGAVLWEKTENLSIAASQMNNSDFLFGGTIPYLSLILSGNDTVFGSPFADLLSGDAGDDIINGGLGNDVFLLDAGTNQLDGGLGVDTVDMSIGGFRRADVNLRPGSNGTWNLSPISSNISSNTTLRNIEYLKFTDTSVSLLDLALGSPVPPDIRGTQVFRFAKLDSGQYFYTGSVGERDLIVATMSNFRYEGPVFFAQDNWVMNYNPVYRFANMLNGGYFYTASAAERDSVISDYPFFRYEGASFFVPASAGGDTVPVFRLANTRTGGYLFTTNSAERQYAQSLGFFRDEGIAFNAPRTISLADTGQDALVFNADESLALAGIAVLLPHDADGLL